MATVHIPACFGVYSTKKLLALFSVTFGNICLPVGPTIFHKLIVEYKKTKMLLITSTVIHTKYWSLTTK